MDAFRSWLTSKVNGTGRPLRQVARSVGLSDVGLLYIMTGRTRAVRPDTVRKLSAYFGESEDVLLTMAGIRPTVDEVDALSPETRFRRSLSMDSALSAEDADSLARLYTALRTFNAQERGTSGQNGYNGYNGNVPYRVSY